ncbi:acyl-CoA dehydrogenase [Allosalinactinospora lopnorensis]|uniref:acyl-CoA dehydrogenase n=1 Tax=Allosalinactinospora lopnorensis TaxID=1352348 RepID=UPI000623E18C|nr:acyl-CoA dehydrogenase [Allosalinactinospora lopnorensis]
MAIGITGEHEELAAAVRGWAERDVRPARAAAESARPSFWDALAEQGVLGLHLPEEYGGQGAGLLELAVALEELGYALTPGPHLPTVLASAVIDHCGNDKARAGLLPGLADGTRTAALALGAPLTAVEEEGVSAGRTRMSVSGTAQPVLGGALADVVVVPVVGPGGEGWVVLEAAELDVVPLPSLDVDRGVARVAADGATVPEEAVLTGLTREDVAGIAAVLLGAEAAGIAAWSTRAAAEYAGVREQFGRPIGQFQGIKHKCARMAIAVEQARAVVWDAARAADRRRARENGAERFRFAAAVAGLVAPDSALHCTRDCVQVHGGIGFTWEHDAHRYLRRASTLRALAGFSADWAATAADLALAGQRRPVEVELDDGEDRGLRERIRSEIAGIAAITENGERFAAMADGGWVMPHLPRPWGRAAPPLEQLLIQQELQRLGVQGPGLAIGAWVVPSIAGYGTPEQQERFLRPTLRGALVWCQLFSEPGAGSDLASLSMRAERVQGGHRLTGQKIWTSLAHVAQWGICLARTDPAAVGKHDGITYFVVDMSSPGIEVRPLRELTGETMFNEVFFDDVFVPDDCVIGEPGQGWRVARDTLSNERVALSSGSGIGAGVPELLAFFGESSERAADPGVRTEIGRLVAQGQAIELLGLRVALKQLFGAEPGAEASVRKLLGVEFNQRVADYIWERQGGAAVYEDTKAASGAWARLMLFSRSMTIYGGTTEVQLNIIAERLLGLPRDPEAQTRP